MSTSTIISLRGDFPQVESSNISPAPSAAASNQHIPYKAVARQLSIDLEDSEIRSLNTADQLNTRAQDLAVKTFKQGQEIRIKDRTLSAQSDRIHTLEKSLSETLQEKAVLDWQLRTEKVKNGELTLTNEALNRRLTQNEARRESLQNELDRIKDSAALEQLFAEKNSLTLQLKAHSYTRNGGAVLLLPIVGAVFISSGLFVAGAAALVTAKTFTYIADTTDRLNTFGSGTQDKLLRATEVDKQITAIQARIEPSDRTLLDDGLV